MFGQHNAMDIEHKRMNTHQNQGNNKRYFGKDITNTDHNKPLHKESIVFKNEYNKSSDVDLKKQSVPKQSIGIGFYKDLIDNQKRMHRRQPTNENINHSTFDEKNEGKRRSKSRIDTFDLNNQNSLQNIVKQNLSKLLKVKSKVSHSYVGEGSQDRISKVRDFQRSKDRCDNKKPSTMRNCINSNKFTSLLNMGIPNKPTSAVNRQYVSILPMNSISHTNMDEHSKKNMKYKFQNLRLNIEESKQDNCMMKIESNGEVPDQPKAPEKRIDMVNELEMVHLEAQRGGDKRGSFDTPFMWSYLLSQNVYSISCLEEHVSIRVSRQAHITQRVNEEDTRGLVDRRS